jgi:hypothetical protein
MSDITANLLETQKSNEPPEQQSLAARSTGVTKLWRLLEFCYVPLATVCLVLGFTHWFRGSETFNPLQAAQNSRLRFQTGGESSYADAGLSPPEVALAEQTLDKDFVADGKHTELLYLGNSQTLSIMDPMPGDMITPQWLQVYLARNASPGARPFRVNLGSLPNLTMPEAMIKLVAAGESSPRQVDVVLLSAVLEEFRGLSIRDEIAAVAKTPAVKSHLMSLANANSDLTTVHSSLEPVLGSGPAANVPVSDSRTAEAQAIESYLQRHVEKLPLFADRDSFQGQILLAYHESRNRLLGITSASARPVPDAAYRATMELIELALRYAAAKNIPVVVYLAPIRPVQPNPNLPADVARFRHDLPLLCHKYKTTCLDYVDVVPAALWTNYTESAAGTEGQRDYAHFTGAAHRLVAEKLMTDMSATIKSAADNGQTSR